MEILLKLYMFIWKLVFESHSAENLHENFSCIGVIKGLMLLFVFTSKLKNTLRDFPRKLQKKHDQ